MLIAVIIVSMCCDRDDCHKYIHMDNTSDKPIYFDYGNDYPDTCIRPVNPVSFGNDFKIDKRKKQKIPIFFHEFSSRWALPA